MKRNQNFDHNHSQKVLSCRYNMDTNRVEARFEDGTTLSIDCIAIEDEYGNTPTHHADAGLVHQGAGRGREERRRPHHQDGAVRR